MQLTLTKICPLQEPIRGRQLLPVLHTDVEQEAEDLRTRAGRLYSKAVKFVRGNFESWDAWDPAIRCLYSGRAIYDPERLEFLDRDGQPLDLHRRFVVESGGGHDARVATNRRLGGARLLSPGPEADGGADGRATEPRWWPGCRRRRCSGCVRPRRRRRWWPGGG